MPGKVGAARIKLRKVKEAEEAVEEGDENNGTAAEQSPEARRKSRRTSSEDGKKQNVHYQVLKALSSIIASSQHKSEDVESLIVDAVEVYKRNERKVFIEVLWRMMITAFQVKEKQDNIDRLVQFFYELVGHIVRYEHKEMADEEMEVDGNDSAHDLSLIKKDLFSHRLLRICEKYHDEGRPQVRVRIVQTMVKVCEACQTMDDIENGLKKKITNVLLIRLKDKNHSVRLEAAKGLCYFQGGQGCPVTRKMMEFIRMDPRPEVRKALVLSIVLDSDDYGDFLDRVADVHPEVRRACLRQVREISLASVSLEDRVRIVHCGLNDVSPAVKEETVKLIQHWYKVCGDNPLELLLEFDLYNNFKLCLKIFHVLFEEVTEENWNTLSNGLLVDKLLPLEGISETKMFLWWYLFHKFSSDPFYAEKLFPDLAELATYCSKLIEKLETEHFDDDERHKIMALFLKIVLFIPAEEGGRLALDKIARSAFKFKHKSLAQMRFLVTVLHGAHPNGCDDVLLEIIRDMMEVMSCEKPVNEVLNQELREERIRELKLKLSEILHRKYNLRKEKEQLIQNNNFLDAHAVQEKMKEVEDEANDARLELQNYENDDHADKLETEEAQQDEPQNYTPEALYYAFSAFSVHLKLVTRFSGFLRNFYNAEVFNAIFREENILRVVVIEIMTQVGLFNIEDALNAMVVCLQAVINETGEVKQMALRCIFDLVLQYGLDSFQDPKILNVFHQMEEVPEGEMTVAELLRQLLTSFIRSTGDPLTQHITVLGMLKLLIMGRLKNAKIVATLLTFWANSANEGTKVYHDIGSGLSTFVQQSSEKAETVAKALVPSVSKVITAPSNSSFRRVDPEKLMGFITMQTDQSRLKNLSKPHIPHEIIAFDVIDEIRKRPLCADNMIFVKALKGLSLVGISRESLTELKGKLKHVMKEELRTLKLSLAAFGKYLDELDPEVKKLDEMSDPESSSSDIEPEDDDKTDMFNSMNSTVVEKSVLSNSKNSTVVEKSVLSNSKAASTSRRTNNAQDSDAIEEDDEDDTLVSNITTTTKKKSKGVSLSKSRSLRK